MSNRLPLILILLTGLGLVAGSRSAAMPQVFASPIQVGCYRVSPGECRLQIDPFTIQISAPQRLAAFQLRANGNPIYDFRTDLANPPLGNYSPSSPKLGFAAVCGQTYTVNLLARDSGDAGFLNAGQAETITCPAALVTATATPIPQPSPGGSNTQTPTLAAPTPSATPAPHTLYLPIGQK